MKRYRLVVMLVVGLLLVGGAASIAMLPASMTGQSPFETPGE